VWGYGTDYVYVPSLSIEIDDVKYQICETSSLCMSVTSFTVLIPCSASACEILLSFAPVCYFYFSYTEVWLEQGRTRGWRKLSTGS
jgi:hypothetical protein